MTNFKIINGHVFSSWYMGTIVYDVDGKQCYDTETAAKWLGISIEELMSMK